MILSPSTINPFEHATVFIEARMENVETQSGWMPDPDVYLEHTSAHELVRRSLLGAPVYVVISLIMLVSTPILLEYGWWAVAAAILLILLGVVRVWFALGFNRRYELIGERAIVQFSVLTALQSLTLGVLAATVIYNFWAAQEVVLTIVVSAAVIAASTSALSVRRSAHIIFILCVLGPFSLALYLVGGLAKAILILGYLILMAFLVQDGGQARRTYLQRIKDQHNEHSKRIKAESELRKLALVVEQSPESIVITNLEAEIEYINEAFIRTSGYSRDELLGENPSIKQSGKTPPDRFLAMWDTLTSGQSWSGELCNQRKDGSEVIELARISPLSQPDGTISHYVAIQEDITEKKKLSEELEKHRNHLEELVKQRTGELAKARQRAEAANQAKSSFLANMSHEIRTPMTAIIGLTALLMQDETEPERSNKLASINAAADDLLAIINDILDLSKIEAGKLSLNPSDFHLNAIFDQIQSLLGTQVSSKGLRIEVDQTDTLDWFWGDPIRLRQALLNYVNNAVKFTPSGTIILRARKVEEQDDEILVRFEVQDTGIGIEPEELDGLFRDFEQVDAEVSRNHNGTGLGLSITRHLARLMGGEAGAESIPGQGSTFWFTARLGRGDANGAIMQAVESVDDKRLLRTRYGSARILLVEDNLLNRELAQTLLNTVGLVIDTAEDGLEAVAKVRANNYDLILMDVQMPRMDGLEATSVIRSMTDKADLPILALTANIYDEDRLACLEAGMNELIAKPFKPDHLFSTIVKWLGTREQPDSRGAKRQTPTIQGDMACEEGVEASPVCPDIKHRDHRVNPIEVTMMAGNDAAWQFGVLRKFVAQTEEIITQIDLAHGKHDAQQISFQVHKLRSSALAIGAVTMADVCLALEVAARDSDWSEIDRLFLGLRPIMQYAG